MTTNYTTPAALPWIKAGEPVEGSINTPAGSDGVANRPIATLAENTEYLRIRTQAATPLYEPEIVSSNFNAAKERSYDITVNANLTVAFPTLPQKGDSFRVRMVDGDRTRNVTFSGSGKLIAKNNTVVQPANYFNYIFTYDGTEWICQDCVSLDLVIFEGQTLTNYLHDLSKQSLKMGIVFIQNSTTAVVGYGHAVDTSARAITLTLPALSVCKDGDRVLFYDAKSTFGTNALTIARNGSLIGGDAVDYKMANDNEAVDLLFIAGNWIPTSNVSFGSGGLIIGPNRNAAFTATKGTLHPILSSGAGLTVTLPANPTIGDSVGFVDYLQNWNISPVTVARNGKLINGAAANVVHRNPGTSVTYRYVDETLGWAITQLSYVGLDGKQIAAWRVTDVNITVPVGQFTWVDTSVNTVTLTLPASPLMDQVVGFGDIAGNAPTNKITILRNGQRIMGIADDLQLSGPNSTLVLRYKGTTYGWRIEDALNPIAFGTQVFEATATAGQVLFPVVYNAEHLRVFKNGSLLSRSDYTATSGITVVLNTGAAAGDKMVFLASVPFAVADCYTKAEANDAFLVSPAFTGTPTAPKPPRFDNTLKVPTTSFVQEAIGNMSGVTALSGTTSLTLNHVGRLLMGPSAAGTTQTLPLLSTVLAGSTITLSAGSGALTLAKQSADPNISIGNTTLATVPIQAFDCITLVSTGTTWRAISGNVINRYYP